ncbi:MAG: FkbM family methyltransferase [Saprospiraceae bacterium]|nr:FkbM family methyltransferase [Saprospiraceae bacterium]
MHNIVRIKINDVSFGVNATNNTAFWEYCGQGLWEPSTFLIIDKFVASGSIMLDIGAWIGPITLYAAARGANVYAIDPDPVAINYLRENIKANPDLEKRIDVSNLALSDNNSDRTLFAREQYGTSSSSLLSRVRDKKSDLQVHALTFDQFIRESGLKRVDFIKMDIEGGEFTLLPTLRPGFIQMDWPTLLLSLHFDHLNGQIYRQKLKARLPALALMKCEKAFHTYLFKRQLIKIFKPIGRFLANYEYIYSITGEIIDPQQILETPWKFSELLCTNTQWTSG